MKKRQSGKPTIKVPERLKPLSLNKLTPEEALSGFMRVNPEKVEDRLKKDGVKKDKK